MSEAPLVSIALCTFNGSRFLAEQLDSLLAQSCSNVQIVAVDDCSADNTREILAAYALKDSRIEVHANPINLGFKKNFEKALSLCRGLLIAPCDQDDIWLPSKLATLVDALGERQLTYCDSTLANEAGQATGPRMSAIVPTITTDDPVPFAFGNCVSGHAMLFRRELLSLALPIPAEFFHDWWIAAVAAAYGGIVFHPESLVLYRQHGSNVTTERLGEMIDAAGLGGGVTRKPSARPRGIGLQHFRETQRRLAAIARLPGRHQEFAIDLYEAWSRRERQWLSPRLGLLLLANRQRILQLANLPERKARRYARDALFGLRLKRLSNPQGYSDT